MRSVLPLPGLLAIVLVLLIAVAVVVVAMRLDRARPESTKDVSTQPTEPAPEYSGRVIHGRLSQAVDGGILVLARDLPPSIDRAVFVGWTDVAGDSFHFEGIDEPGLYTAFLRGTGTDWSRIPVYVKESPVDLGLVELVPRPDLLHVSGTVRDHEGEPIRGALVSYAVGFLCGEFDFGTTESLTTSANEAGAFLLFPYDPDLRLEVFVEADGYRGQGVEAKWGERLEITLEAAGLARAR